jgi:hypothetical protein
MKVPATLDLDRVLEAALVAVPRAMQSWSEGGLQTEEPLLNHLIGELSRKRRSCDIGGPTASRVVNQIALLHRKGDGNTDKFGADLAVTLSIADGILLKTALFQVKVGDALTGSFARSQLEDATSDQQVRERAFVCVFDRGRLRTRVKQADAVLANFKSGAANSSQTCHDWDTLGERRLSSYVVERRNETSSWTEPWRPEGGQTVNRESNGIIPAKAWLMIFVVPESSSERA